LFVGFTNCLGLKKKKKKKKKRKKKKDFNNFHFIFNPQARPVDWEIKNKKKKEFNNFLFLRRG
jgi:hypothetical protein